MVESDGIIIMWDRIIMFANQAAANIYGSEAPEKMVGSNILDFIAESEHGRIDELEKLPINSEQFKVPFQIEGFYSTGEPAVYEITVNDIPYEGDEATLLTIRDITARVNREKRIRSLHESTARLGGATSQEAMIEIVLDSLQGILGMDYASVAFVEGNKLVFKRQHRGRHGERASLDRWGAHGQIN